MDPYRGAEEEVVQQVPATKQCLDAYRRAVEEVVEQVPATKQCLDAYRCAEEEVVEQVPATKQCLDACRRAEEEVVEQVPATKQCLDSYRWAEERDLVCQLELEYCRQGWTGKESVRPDMVPFWNTRDFLTECNKLLMYGHISTKGDTAEDAHWASRHAEPGELHLYDVQELASKLPK